MHKNLLLSFVAISLIFISFAWAKEVDLAQLKQKELKHKCEILERLGEDESKTDPVVIAKRKSEMESILKELGSNQELKKLCE